MIANALPTSAGRPAAPRRRRASALALLCALGGIVPSPAAAAETKVPHPKTFRDWIVGCDNIRRCTALGVPSGRDASGYVVVKRDGAAEAGVQVSLVVRTEELIRSPLAMEIRIDGAPPYFLAPTYEVGADKNDIYTARLDMNAKDSKELVSNLRDGSTLDLSVKRDGKTIATAKISLAGATSAFMFMDVDQFRTTTDTAILGRQVDHPPAVPPVPPIPVLTAMVMKPVKPPPGHPPAGVSANVDDCSEPPPPPQVIHLSAGLELWGMCYVGGSYNAQSRYWIVEHGHAKPAAFIIPGREPRRDGPDVLPDTYLTEDGRVLEATEVGRGLGDCGMDAQWVWTGSAFQLAELSEMPDCRGVRAQDWPVMYTSQWK